MADDFGHVPVLLDRCVELLLPALTRHDPDGSGAVLVDATLGARGHSERFLTDLPGLRVIGLDRDPSALQIARDRLAPFVSRFTAVRTRYDGIVDALGECGYAASGSIDGVLFDLGVSSMQLDRTERGFSYAADAPLRKSPLDAPLRLPANPLPQPDLRSAERLELVLQGGMMSGMGELHGPELFGFISGTEAAVFVDLI